ncbi:MAG TPA: hypothetical protein VN653_08630 [Anaerolineales bacterium]|nr:hypothetical protein [Anaerolineales bacterium]
MFSRFRIAFGLALLLTLATAVTVFAKGSFSFIIITGSNLKSEIRTTDPALTTDFFTFADFSRNRVDAPANPGEAYEVTRYYIENTRESAFDQLHYYPDTGYVFYDGIVNGSSEYDGKWYKADPEIKSVFEKAISVESAAPIIEAQPVPAEVEKPIAPVQPETTTDGTQSISSLLQKSLAPVLLASALALVMLFVVWSRRAATR